MVGGDGDMLLLANLYSCPCLYIPNPYHRGNRERNKRRILSSLCPYDGGAGTFFPSKLNCSEFG